ncbi:hypothetical protein IFVP408_C2110135 [Vibrio parahaemolyticus]
MLMKHSISVLSRSVEVSINTASNFVKGFGTTCQQTSSQDSINYSKT